MTQPKGIKFSKHLNVRSKQSNFNSISKKLKKSEISLTTAKGELTGIVEETSRKSEDEKTINNMQQSPDLHPMPN